METMDFNLMELIDMLEINDQRLDDLKNRIYSLLGDREGLRVILDEHEMEQKETRCFGCDKEGDCFILHGIVRLELGDVEDAISAIKQASLHLHSKDETWNSICGLILLGMAYEMIGKHYQAIFEYERAQHILKSIYMPLHLGDYIEKARLLGIKLEHKLRNIH